MSFSLNHFLSAVNVVPILFFATVFNLFSWRLTLASLEVAIFYKAATLGCENFNLASLNFPKVAKTNTDCVLSAFTISVFFSCPTSPFS